MWNYKPCAEIKSDEHIYWVVFMSSHHEEYTKHIRNPTEGFQHLQVITAVCNVKSVIYSSVQLYHRQWYRLGSVALLLITFRLRHIELLNHSNDHFHLTGLFQHKKDFQCSLPNQGEDLFKRRANGFHLVRHFWTKKDPRSYHLHWLLLISMNEY